MKTFFTVTIVTGGIKWVKEFMKSTDHKEAVCSK